MGLSASGYGSIATGTDTTPSPTIQYDTTQLDPIESRHSKANFFAY